MKKFYLILVMITLIGLSVDAQKKILFIGSGSAAEADGDKLIYARIEALDYEFDTMKLTSGASDDSWFPDDFRTKYDGFVISSSISSNHLKNFHPNFHYINKPILCWEQGYYGKMGMGGGTQPTMASGTSLTVQSGFESHAVVGSFTSGTAVLTGELKGSLVKIAEKAKGLKALLTTPDGNIALGIVEAGDSINNDTVAAARRAIYFGHSEYMTNVNEAGLALFDRTLQWILGDIGGSQIMDPTFNKLSVYSNGKNIHFSNSQNVNEIHLFGINGVLYKTVQVDRLEGTVKVDVPAGLYIAKIISGNVMHTEKIIIQ